jgi:hypothetical protein
MGASVRIATVDWPRVIHEIRGGGLMLKAIASRIGVAQTTISAYATGQTKEPPYSIGVKLLELRDRVAL